MSANDNIAVRWASRYGHLEVVKFLVEQGADTSANDNEALKWASGKGHLEIVNFLNRRLNNEEICENDKIEEGINWFESFKAMCSCFSMKNI